MATKATILRNKKVALKITLPASNNPFPVVARVWFAQVNPALGKHFPDLKETVIYRIVASRSTSRLVAPHVTNSISNMGCQKIKVVRIS